jgi:hypothetical protein
VVSEFIDNAFDEDGGNATKVELHIWPDELSVRDNGRGISDINRLARLGDSGSVYTNGDNLGQFGIGAKAWMCRGGRLIAQTIHEGMEHLHIFNLRSFMKAHERRDPNPPHLLAYEGKGRKTSEASFTQVTIADFFGSAKKPIVLPALMDDLQERYWPALKKGLEIKIIDARKTPQEIKPLIPLTPPSWTNNISWESSVNDKKYSAEVGILSEGIGRYSGIFVGCLYRTIEKMKVLSTLSLPPRIHGQVVLSKEWKESLSNYKDKIVNEDDREGLLRDIEKHAATVIAEAEEYTEDLRLENIALEIERVANAAMKSSEGNLRLVRDRKPGPPNPGPPHPPRPKPHIKPTKLHIAVDNEKERDTNSGIRFRFEPLGHDTMGEVRILGRSVLVALNKECPKIEAVSKERKYPGLYLEIGTQLADYANTNMNVDEIEDLFGGMLKTAAGTGKKEQMCKEIRLWWGFEAMEEKTDEGKRVG